MNVHFRKFLFAGIAYMEDASAVQPHKALAGAGKIGFSLVHHHGIRNAAVTVAIGVIKTSGVDARHRVKFFYHFRHGVAPDTEVFRNGTHNDPGRVQNDHHKPGIAGAGDPLQDDAIAIIIRKTPGVGLVGGPGLLGQLNEGGIRLNILLQFYPGNRRHFLRT